MRNKTAIQFELCGERQVFVPPLYSLAQFLIKLNQVFPGDEQLTYHALPQLLDLSSSVIKLSCPTREALRRAHQDDAAVEDLVTAAEVLFQRGQCSKAIDCLNKALAQDEQSASAKYMHAMIIMYAKKSSMGGKPRNFDHALLLLTDAANLGHKAAIRQLQILKKTLAQRARARK